MAKMTQALLLGLKIIIHGSKLPLGFRLKETALAILRRGVSNCKRTAWVMRHINMLISPAPHSRSCSFLLRSYYTLHPALPDAGTKVMQIRQNARGIFWGFILVFLQKMLAIGEFWVYKQNRCGWIGLMACLMTWKASDEWLSFRKEAKCLKWKIKVR